MEVQNQMMAAAAAVHMMAAVAAALSAAAAAAAQSAAPGVVEQLEQLAVAAEQFFHLHAQLRQLHSQRQSQPRRHSSHAAYTRAAPWQFDSRLFSSPPWVVALQLVACMFP